MWNLKKKKCFPTFQTRLTVWHRLGDLSVKVIPWSHNSISVGLLNAWFIGFLFILNASRRHRLSSGLTFSFTTCKMWTRSNMRNIKGWYCHYHWKLTISLKWIITILANKKKFYLLMALKGKKLLLQPTKKVNIVWCLRRKDNMSAHTGCMVITKHGLTQLVLDIMWEPQEQCGSLHWQPPSCLSQLPAPICSKG